MKGVLYGTHKSLKDICNYLEEGIFEIFLIYFIYHIKIGSMYSYVVQKKINNTMQKIHFLARSRKSIKFKFTKPH